MKTSKKRRIKPALYILGAVLLVLCLIFLIAEVYIRPVVMAFPD